MSRYTPKKVAEEVPLRQRRGPGWVVSPEVRSRMIRLAAKGLSTRQIAAIVDHGKSTVWMMLAPLGGVFTSGIWEPPAGSLTIEERCEITLGLERAETFSAIALVLGRAPSTVSREVNANGGRDHYKPIKAHRRAFECSRRPKPTKLGSDPHLCALVARWLEQLLSPEQIAGRLRLEFPDAPHRWVSHETIYKSLYVQGRGELRRELAACLRTGRAQRRSQSRATGGRISDMVMISDRPAEIEDRAVPGHWEGDLIIGKDNQSAVGTLVERTTRYVMLLHLPAGYGAKAVRDAMTTKIAELPDTIMRSITWDQGIEMAQHQTFTIDTDVDVYFCDPHSPWQRGTNENTNGLLRQYMPKSTDLSVHDSAALDAIAESLNNRPRKTLGFRTPTEVFTDLVATTA